MSTRLRTSAVNQQHTGASRDRSEAPVRSVVREGIGAGALGATAVALWFLAVDALTGAPFFTPARLGAALFGALGVLPPPSAMAAALAYTAVHYAAFGALGVGAAAVSRLARREPTVLAGALLAFVVAEAAFHGLVALLHETDLLGALTWARVGAANLIAAATMGAALSRAHPDFGGALATGLAGWPRTSPRALVIPQPAPPHGTPHGRVVAGTHAALT